MDFLKAELDRKRKQLKKEDLVVPQKKYFRRGDLAAKQQEEYWAKYYEKNKESGKETTDNEEKSTDDAAVNFMEENSSNQHVSDQEVRRRLRERAEPIRLFGETDKDTLRRLRKLEIEAPELKEGRRNDFQSAMDSVDQEYVNEVVQGTLNEEGRHDVEVEKLQTIEEIKEMADVLGHGNNPRRDCEIIFAFFNYLLQRWGHDLNARPEHVKRSGEGKFAAARHAQTIEHVKPLFRKLRNKSLPDDIRMHLVPITRYMLDRDYIQANNAYMAMSIGNAPWPVGVTRSGVHQRPGSEKSYVKNIAHVLNDETQRKYIQGLKRFMTKCQEYFPSDPSKCVDFVPKDPGDA